MAPGPAHQVQRPGPWALVLLACVLVLAQVLLAGHQVEHLGHADGDAACAVCLIGGGLGAPLVACPPALAPPAQGLGPALATGLPSTPVCNSFRPQAPRAPPVSLRSVC